MPKVAITGLGLVSPFGAGQTSFFSALADGRSALALHPELSSTLPGDLARQPVWAGRVPDFGADKAVEAGKRRRMPRLSQMAIVAAREAITAPLVRERVARERTEVCREERRERPPHGLRVAPEQPGHGLPGQGGAQVGLSQVSAAQIRAHELCSAQVSMAELGSGQRNPLQLCPREV